MFCFAGGFAVADLYSGSVRPLIQEQIAEQARRLQQQQPAQSFSWLTSKKAKVVPAPAAPQHPLDTLRGDLDEWIENNQVLALIAMCMILSGGGFFGIAGAATFVIFDGEAGSERYLDAKDAILDYFEGDV